MEIESLRSWTRRLTVVSLQSSYVAEGGSVDVDSKQFHDDTGLRVLLASAIGRLIFLKHHLLPFIQKFSESDCYNALHNPADQLVSDTAAFVQQMANGGLEAYQASDTAGDAEQETDGDNGYQNAHERLVHLVHTNTPNVRFIKNYVISGMKDISGSMKRSKKGKNCRIDNFTKAVAASPYLFHYDQNNEGFRKLNIDVDRMNKILDKHGRAKFGKASDWKVAVPSHVYQSMA
eukprot:13474764-Heterocapsa_arctica.AAC.1